MESMIAGHQRACVCRGTRARLSNALYIGLSALTAVPDVAPGQPDIRLAYRRVVQDRPVVPVQERVAGRDSPPAAISGPPS